MSLHSFTALFLYFLSFFIYTFLPFLPFFIFLYISFPFFAHPFRTFFPSSLNLIYITLKQRINYTKVQVSIETELQQHDIYTLP